MSNLEKFIKLARNIINYEFKDVVYEAGEILSYQVFNEYGDCSLSVGRSLFYEKEIAINFYRNGDITTASLNNPDNIDRLIDLIRFDFGELLEGVK